MNGRNTKKQTSAEVCTLVITKSFPDHKGIIGHQGGSLPKGVAQEPRPSDILGYPDTIKDGDFGAYSNYLYSGMDYGNRPKMDVLIGFIKKYSLGDSSVGLEYPIHQIDLISRQIDSSTTVGEIIEYRKMVNELVGDTMSAEIPISLFEEFEEEGMLIGREREQKMLAFKDFFTVRDSKGNIAFNDPGITDKYVDYTKEDSNVSQNYVIGQGIHEVRAFEKEYGITLDTWNSPVPTHFGPKDQLLYIRRLRRLIDSDERIKNLVKTGMLSKLEYHYDRNQDCIAEVKKTKGWRWKIMLYNPDSALFQKTFVHELGHIMFAYVMERKIRGNGWGNLHKAMGGGGIDFWNSEYHISRYSWEGWNESFAETFCAWISNDPAYTKDPRMKEKMDLIQKFYEFAISPKIYYDKS